MNVVVIGGGAAGLLAAITSAKEGNKVILLEKTHDIGNKIAITGKGRCNVTFSGDFENFKSNIVKNEKFMYSSFAAFNNNDVVSYFESTGVKTKVERGKRVFPVSDDAQEIIKTLRNELKKYNVKLITNSKVEKICTIDNKVSSVITSSGNTYKCDKCIIATGGKSYSKTGSNGDGYTLAESLGHSIVDIKAGLVALRSNNQSCKNLQGLSLKNIGYKLYNEKKLLYEDFGELMFAHFGITGPVVLSSSSILNRTKSLKDKLENKKIKAFIDLKPALDFETLDKRICRDFEKYSNKEFKNSLNDLLPQKLIPEIIKISQIPEMKKVHQISKLERQRLVKVLKEFEIIISHLMPLEGAIITCGGVNVKEIDPKTMQSKLIKGVYFAGEILDVDALTGGYNLQIAFSTAVAAGKNYINKEEKYE